MKYIHISAKVDRRIEDLKNAGKAGKGVARKATFIIESLTSGAIRNPTDAVGSFTKYGEKRIRNCRKYDLGCGYRLLTLQRGLKVFVSLLGTHDECQRWLENNSRLKEVDAGNGALFRISCESQPPEGLTNADSADIEEDDKNEELLKISDQDLRRVFCGLVEAVRMRNCRD